MNKEEYLERIKKICEAKGGFCLSKKYKHYKEPLKFQCFEGHIWDVSPGHILDKKNPTWCPKCARINNKIKQSHTLKDMQVLVNKKGGKCLSNEYVNAHSKLEWQCEKGHRWFAVPMSISKGYWCPECGVKICSSKRRKSIKDVYDISVLNKGKCLSDLKKVYKNAHVLLKWECEFGHIWSASYHNVEQGHWCPYCQCSNKESECREIFEELFQKPFPISRPKWLFSKGQLEFDGFNEEVGIAFEYDGPQHYDNMPKYFHKRWNFEEQLRRDKDKNKCCVKQGVWLIRVPYFVKFNKLREFILLKLKDNGGVLEWI